MTTRPLIRLRELRQSVWLDYIDRNLIENGGLDSLIREDGPAGVTSNPAIFEKAITGGRECEASLRALARRGLDNAALLETLLLEDVGRAAELLRPVFDQAHGDDGFVSRSLATPRARHRGNRRRGPTPVERDKDLLSLTGKFTCPIVTAPAFLDLRAEV